MDFGAFPPEVNSSRMYGGSRSGSLLEAADAWERLAEELNGTVTAYRATVATLSVDGWQGSASDAMSAATAPYLRWLTRTAETAETIAGQARMAANAFDDAFAATVPPPAIGANRRRLATLVAANATGQDTPAIAALEADYGEMWAQDAAAMYRYAAASATAATLPPLAPPLLGYNMPALMGADDANSAGAGEPEMLAPAMPAVPQALRSLAGPVRSAAATSAIARLLRQCKFSSPMRAFAWAISSSRSLTSSGNSAGLSKTPGPPQMTPTMTVGRGVVVGRLVVPPSWGGVAIGAVRAIA
jgi:PPE-repeat protein